MLSKVKRKLNLMRKFTLILVAAMTALSLSAAAGTHTTRIRGQVENPALKARLQKMPAVINGHKLDSRLLEHPEKAQSIARCAAPRKPL